MTMFRRMFSFASAVKRRARAGALRGFGYPVLQVVHYSMAFLGMSVLAMTLFFFWHTEVRETFETKAMGWLQARSDARAEPGAESPSEMDTLGTADMVSRTTAADPRRLTPQQASVARWISRRYRVAPEPISRLVKEAWSVGPRVGLEPTLILAIMAVESRFNPFAQSAMGAQGLMQVMTRVHDDKFERFGGILAAFDPVTNLHVGAQVLRDCIRRSGDIEAGLRSYVGAANHADDGGYAGKVLAVQRDLKNAAAGWAVPTIVPGVAMPVESLAVPSAEPAALGET